MLNLLPLPADEPATTRAPEPVLRLASIHAALRLVDDFGGGPASDFEVGALAEDWGQAGVAEQRCFDRRSAELLAAASAGLELVANHRRMGSDVSPAAMQLLADEIRAGIADIEKLVRD